MPGILFNVFWAIVYNSRSRPKGLLTAFVVVILGCGCIGLLLPAFSSAREAARRMQCLNNLKQIALALHNYHDVYGVFPPAYIPDAQGKPKHSWRVLILPFLEEQGTYEKYDFDEPWDGPNNRDLLTSMPRVYACPSHTRHTGTPATATNYLAVVGPSSAWPGPIGKKLSEFGDPTSETILVVEAGSHDIQWTDPRDFSLEEAIARMTSTEPTLDEGHWYEDFFTRRFQGRNVAMADGSVQLVSGEMPREVLMQSLACNDGVALSGTIASESRRAPPKLKIGNCIRLGVWIALVVFPLPWVWWNPNSDMHGRHTVVGSAG